MLMLVAERLPKEPDAVNWEGRHFEIVEMVIKVID
jgi:hypothetical protein